MRPTFLATLLVTVVALTGCAVDRNSPSPLEPTPTQGVSETPARVIALIGELGDFPMSLEIFDRASALRDARSATAAELVIADDMVRNGAIEALLADDRTILVRWSGNGCRETGQLFVGPGVESIILVPTIPETCDSMPNTRGVALEFKIAVDFEAIRFDLQPLHAAGVRSAGRRSPGT